jgi:hypothetical protein
MKNLFLPPRTRATGRKHNPNSGYKCPNPHSKYQTIKPLPQEVTKVLDSRTVGKPSFQQKRKLKPKGMPQQE